MGFIYEGIVPTDYVEIKRFMTHFGVKAYNELYGAIPGVKKPEDLIEFFAESGIGPEFEGAPIGQGLSAGEEYRKDFGIFIRRRRESRRREIAQREAAAAESGAAPGGAPETAVDPAQFGLEGNPTLHARPRAGRRHARGADAIAAENRRLNAEIVREQLQAFDDQTKGTLTHLREFEPGAFDADIMPHTIEPGLMQTSWRNMGYTKTQRDNVLGIVSFLSNTRSGRPMRGLNSREIEILNSHYGPMAYEIYTHMRNYDPAFMFIQGVHSQWGSGDNRPMMVRVALGDLKRSTLTERGLDVGERPFPGRDYSPLDLAEFFYKTTESTTGTGRTGVPVNRSIHRLLTAHDVLLNTAADVKSKANALRGIGYTIPEGRFEGDQIRHLEESIAMALEQIRRDPAAAEILKDLMARGELKQSLDEFRRVLDMPRRTMIDENPVYGEVPNVPAGRQNYDTRTGEALPRPGEKVDPSDPNRARKLEFDTDEEIAKQARVRELERLIRGTYFDHLGGKGAVVASGQRAEYAKLPPGEAAAKMKADRAGWQAELDALKGPSAPPKISQRFRNLELDESLIKKILKEEYKKLLQEQKNTIYN
jgi:hypothetical protein